MSTDTMLPKDADKVAKKAIPTALNAIEESESKDPINDASQVLEAQAPKATAEEQADFDNYERSLKSQSATVESYNKLLDNKVEKETVARIKSLNEVIGMRIMQMQAQPGTVDRLKLPVDFYEQLWSAVKTGQLFNGDVIRQCRLLDLLAGQLNEIEEPKKVREQLEKEFPEFF